MGYAKEGGTEAMTLREQYAGDMHETPAVERISYQQWLEKRIAELVDACRAAIQRIREQDYAEAERILLSKENEG